MRRLTLSCFRNISIHRPAFMLMKVYKTWLWYSRSRLNVKGNLNADEAYRIRTRRRFKPILRGPNPYGRTGTLKCLQCRKWRRKVHSLLKMKLSHQCVYNSPELPCDLCRSRGYECGIHDKVYSAESREIVTTRYSTSIHLKIMDRKIYTVIHLPEHLALPSREFEIL